MRLLSNHKILSTLAALAAGVLSVSCMQKEDFGSEVGYLCPPGLDLDVIVDNLADTKAGEQINLSEAGLSIPTAADVTYTVTDKDGNVVADKNGNTAHTAATWTEPLALPVGSYTITATAGTNTFGTPYFTGTASGTIESLARETTTMTLTLGNSLLKVSVGSTLAEHFTPSSTVTITIDGAEHTADYNNWFYAPSNTSVSMSLSGTNSAGNNTEFTYNNLTTVAGKAFNVICEKDESNWPVVTVPSQQDGAWANRLYITPGIEVSNGTIPMDDIVYEVIESSGDWTTSTPKTSKVVDGYHVVDGLTNGTTYKVRCKVGLFYSAEQEVTIKSAGSVTISHYNDDYGNLAGSNAALSLGLKGVLKTLYDNKTLTTTTYLAKGSTQVRSGSAESETMSHGSFGWPYLPQGSDYILTVNHKLTSDQTATTSTVSNISSPTPTFIVSLGNSYTSYDEYAGTNGITKNVGNANTRNAETIYNVSANWKISSDLMNNSNYSKTLKIYTNSTEQKSLTPTGTSYSHGDIIGLTTWQAYALKVAMTFAGTTIEASKTHYITGLPYEAAPPKNNGNNFWLGTTDGGDSYINWDNTSYVELSPNDNKNVQISSPTFYIPNTINVTVNHSFKKNDANFINFIHYNLHIGSSALINDETLKGNNKKDQSREFTNAQMTSSNNIVKIKATYSTYHAKTYYVRVNSLSIKYR